MRYREDYLTVNKYSRPGVVRKETRAFVIHWVKNPRTSAQFNRDFFESLKEGISAYWDEESSWFASTQWLVDENEIILAMPPGEVSYNCGSSLQIAMKHGQKRAYPKEAEKIFEGYLRYPLSPNYCTEAVEFCHPDWTGEPEEETRQNLVSLGGMRVFANQLSINQILRHYDVVGWKDCPQFYVENPEAWEELRNDIYSESIRIGKKITGG